MQYIRFARPALYLITLLAVSVVNAQDYWDKIPTLTSQCYDEKDDFNKKIQLLRSEIKEQVERSKQAVEEKASKMTDEERMAFAMRYQNMSPDEIVNMQKEMMEVTQAQADFQVKSSAFEQQFNQLEKDFRAAFRNRLGPIEAEYRKLPDGEGTPQWAIKKGEELMIQYNNEYEAICSEYLSSPDARFRIWLKDFNTFLREQEVPYNLKMIKMQYAQLGFTPDESVATLMALDRYLEKCAAIFSLRRPYPQG